MSYTEKRLETLNISNDENGCNNFHTFEPYYYQKLNREFSGIPAKKLDNFHRAADRRQSNNEDNILIKYSTIWGGKMLEKTKGYPKAVERLRFHPSHLLRINNKFVKYKTAKGAKLHPFFNGIYAYYVKQLQEQGLTENQIIEKLKPTFRHIIITEGEFKAFLACKIGLPTIGISGIHNAVKTQKITKRTKAGKEYKKTVSAEFLPELLDFFKLFEVEKVSFLLDSDCFENTGKENRASSFFASVRNFFFACARTDLDLDFVCIRPTARGKGLDDLFVNDALYDSVITFPLRSRKDLSSLEILFADSVRNSLFFGRKGQKASELLEGAEITNKWLIISTGGGKTFLAANSAGVKIILCPTTSLVKNICNEYGGFEARGRGNRWRQRLEQAKEDNNLPSLIVSTYKGLKSLIEIVSDTVKDIHLFIDEAHNFSAATSQGFMLEECRYMLEQMPNFKAVTLLTGTYIYNADPYLNSLDRLKLIIPRPSKCAQVVQSENTLKTASILVTDSIRNGRFPIVLFDNKSTDGRLGTLKTLIDDDRVKCFNSDNKMDLFFQELTLNSNIEGSVNGIVTTSVLREGNNIYNPYCFDVIIVGNFHPSAIEQILNRPRKAKEIRLYIVKKRKEQVSDLPNIFNPANYSKFIEQKALNTCNELNTQDDLTLEYYKRELWARKAIQYLPIRLDDGVYCVDYLALSNYIYDARKVAENQNIDLLKKSLNGYGIEFICDLSDASIISKQEQQGTIEARKQSKKEKEAEYEKEVQELSKQHEDYIVTYCEDYRGRKDTTPIKKVVCTRYLRLSEYLPKYEVIQQLEIIGISSAKFRRLTRQLNIVVLESSNEYMSSNREFSMLIRNIRDSFQDGEVLSSDEIRRRLLICLQQSVSRSFDLSKIEAEKRNTRALSRLRLFYDVVRVTRKIEGIDTSMFTVRNSILRYNIKKQYPKIELRSDFQKIEQAVLKQDFGLEIVDGYPKSWG